MLVQEGNYACLGMELCLFRNGFMFVQELIKGLETVKNIPSFLSDCNSTHVAQENIRFKFFC